MLTIRTLSWGIAVALVTAVTVQAAEDVVPIGEHTQLVVDDVLFAAKQGVVRRTHACRKLPHPVLEPERPWEGRRVYVYGTVIRDPDSGQFRMWYMSRSQQPGDDSRLRYSLVDFVLYATSHDGAKWVRPDLGLVKYGESTDNNIVFGMHSPSILLDRTDSDPTRRYKMLGYGNSGDKRGYCAAISPNGLDWSGLPDNPVLDHGDTITLTYDPKTREYLAFHKKPGRERGHYRRMVYLATSPDFHSWSKPELVLAPDAEDDTWATGPEQRTEFYNLSAFPYAGQFLGLVTVFRKTRRLANVAPEQSPDDGPIDVQLVHSRDGRHWSRSEDRSPVIPNGPHSYDAGCILGVANAPVLCGDEMVIYYTAITTTHGGAMPEKKISIAWASWPRDRFVSLDASSEGRVETVALRPTGSQLHVNADARDGSLVVEVLGDDGRLLPGYSAENCEPLNSDDLDRIVRWKEHSNLPGDRPIRLRFYLRRASLFAFGIRSGT